MAPAATTTPKRSGAHSPNYPLSVSEATNLTSRWSRGHWVVIRVGRAKRVSRHGWCTWTASAWPAMSNDTKDKTTLDYAIDDGLFPSRKPAARTNSRHNGTRRTPTCRPQRSRRWPSCAAPQGDVVQLLAYTGLRFGELVGLRTKDVDLAARRFRVKRSITQVGGNPSPAGSPGGFQATRRSPRRTVPFWHWRTGSVPLGGGS